MNLIDLLYLKYLMSLNLMSYQMCQKYQLQLEQGRL
jgi:hypothetical protein